MSCRKNPIRMNPDGTVFFRLFAFVFTSEGSDESGEMDS